MKHLNWAKADHAVRVRLVKSAYTAHVRMIMQRSGESYETFSRALLSEFYEGNLYDLIVCMCEKNGFDGVDYIKAQFYFWPKSDRYPLVPPLRVIAGGKRAVRNLQKWYDAQASEPVHTPRAKYQKVMKDADWFARSFMRDDPKSFPTLEAVLKHPMIRQMLPKCYLTQAL